MVRREKFTRSTLEVIPENDLLSPYTPLKLTRIVPTGGEREDVYEKYKPKKEAVIDYNLSQTYIKCRAGETELDVKETKATYEFRAQEDIKALREKARAQYSSSGPPCWVFVDEIWRKKIEATQKIYQERFEQLCKSRRKELSKGRRHLHQVLQALAGPEWYQELSPNQIKTVDRLEFCIKTDIDTKTIANTRENLANLGLLPKPRPKKIKMALKYSCQCPVEFLLVLYQILDPYRQQYSQNDRLVLSAVVHLTMTMTLRELHIRIPSPPKYKEPTKKKPKRPKRKEYSSPYLVPYTFKPEKPKFTGVYYDKHIQYPESIYFSYLGSMYACMYYPCESYEDAEGLEEDEVELLEDLDRAQLVYNTVHSRNDVKLLISTVIKSCPAYTEFEKISEATTEDGGLGGFGLGGKGEPGGSRGKGGSDGKGGSEKEEEKPLVLPPLPPLPDRRIKCHCHEPIRIDTCCDFDEPIDCDCCTCKCKDKTTQYVSSLCEKCASKARHKNANNIIGGIALVGFKIKVPIVNGTYSLGTCNCMEIFKNRMKALEAKTRLQCRKQKFVVGGLVISKCGPVYCLSTVVSQARLCKLYRLMDKMLLPEDIEEPSKKVCSEKCTRDINQDDTGQVQPISLEKVTVCCPEDKKCNAPVDNDGKCNAPGTDKKKCICQSSSSSEGDCRCKEELEKFLSNQCQCDECNAAERRAKATYIISGTCVPIDKDYKQVVRIIEGVRNFNCDCLVKYMEKIKKFEDYRKRIRARMELKSQSVKYAIRGVVSTDAGPVYEICGTRPPVECICARLQREREERERQALQRAKMPNTGRIKYEIAGVMEGQDENVYILNQAMPIEKCKCEQLFDRYEKVHDACLSTYREFLKKVDDEVAEYEQEMGAVISRSPDPEQQDFCFCAEEQGVAIKDGEEYDEKGSVKKESDEEERTSVEKACLCKPEPSFSQPCCCTCMDRELADQAEDAAKLAGMSSQVSNMEDDEDEEDDEFDGDEDEEDVCTCEQETEDEDVCKCRDPSQENEEETDYDEEITDLDTSVIYGAPVKTTESESTDSITIAQDDLIRYVILKKFPKTIKAKNEVLKKVLNQMAIDGFPLAKLPDCHKLPHFRLWLELRSGTYWTIKDRKRFNNFSISAWGHTDVCYRKRNAEVVGVKKAEYKHVTWASANFWKEVMNSRRRHFFSLTKRDFINHAREFFPSTVSYEFPNRTYRDVFFAYCPAKEEDFLLRDTSAL